MIQMLLGQETEHDPVELLWALHAGHVGGVRDVLETGSGDLVAEAFGDTEDVGLVVVADDEQGGRGHLVGVVAGVLDQLQLLGRVAALLGVLVGAQLHVVHQAPHVGVHLARLSAHAVHPEANGQVGGGVQLAVHEEAYLLAAVCHHLVRPAGVRQSRTDQHQRRDQLWPGQRRLERDAAAQRVPDQHRPFDLEPVEQVEQVLGMLVGLRRQRRLPEPAHVVAHHLVVLGVPAPLRLPHSAVGDAGVDQDDRVAGAGDLMAKLHRGRA